MNLEFLKALPAVVNRFLLTGALAVALIYAACNIGQITQSIAERTGTLHDVKVFGAELTFDAQNLYQHAALFEIDKFDRTASTKIAADIERLDPQTVTRLIYVDTHKNLCLYDPQTAERLEDMAADYRMQDLKLAVVADSEEVKAAVEKMPLSERPAPGVPLRCYTVTLTPAGQDARTVLVKMLAAAFAAQAPSTPLEKAPATSSQMHVAVAAARKKPATAAETHVDAAGKTPAPHEKLAEVSK